MRRRQFLAVTALPVGLSGCSAPLTDSEASRLGSVVIANRHEEARTVDFRVEWDDEMVHDRTYDLLPDDAGGNASTSIPERTWPETPGRFRVLARRDGKSWQTADPADWGYPDCFGVYVDIDPRGRVAIFVSTDSYECSDEAIDAGASETGNSDDR